MATAETVLAEEPLDTAIRLVTPERITFRYPLAGPFRRAIAYLIDQIFWTFLLVVGAIAIALLSVPFRSLGIGIGTILVLFFILNWFYAGFCEAVFNGRTLGKAFMEIRVVSVDGVPITAGQAILRNLLWVAEWAAPLAFMPAIASMLMTRRFQRLGDLAAGTMVIVERRPGKGGVVRLDDPASAALLPLLPTRIPAGPDLSRALSDYVQHRGRFNRERREEMAGRLARPARDRFGLPQDATHDAILCALYRRVFLGE